VNNSYDRDEADSPSEAAGSPCKASWGVCGSCGIYHFVRPSCRGISTGREMCPACYERFGSRRNLAEISEVPNAGG